VRRAAPLALALLLAACSGESGGAEGAYKRGREALAANDPRRARVELLNAVQAEQKNALYRIALAEAQLTLGDGVAAEAELTRARALGAAAEETAHLMAHALLLQGQAERALAETERAAPAHAAYAGRMRGRALQALGDTAGAAEAFNQALAAAPNDGDLWTDIARFRRSGGELGGALEAADRAVAADPDNLEALVLRGELTRGQYGLAAALPWFDKALEIDEGNITALLERAATLGDMGRTRDMLADTRAVLSIAPGNPVAFYLQAMLAARARNFTLARSLYNRTAGALDGQPAGILLSSVIDVELGNPEQAITRLGPLLQGQPDNRKARRLLAAAQWRQGDAAGAAQTLRPLADHPDADAYVLALMGRALAKLGDDVGAARYLAQAARPRSGSALLGEPVDDVALAAMRRTADEAPNDASQQIPLIRALLGRGLGAEALTRAERLQARNPQVPDAHILVGDAYGIRGDFRAAVRNYQRAANITFSEPVALRLIEALRLAGNSAGGDQVLRLFLKQNPNNVPAQLLAAAGHLQAGQWDEAIRLYERLRVRLGNRDATLLNNLAWAYGEKGDYARAIPLARHAWNLDRRNPATTDTFGWLLVKSGTDRLRGIALIEQAARGAPSDRQILNHLEAARRG
jgi:tetratricopeptide (TPR) repeat protein